MERKCHEEGGADLKVQNESKDKTGQKKIPLRAWICLFSLRCVGSGLRN
jgi:hypothetical protein